MEIVSKLFFDLQHNSTRLANVTYKIGLLNTWKEKITFYYTACFAIFLDIVSPAIHKEIQVWKFVYLWTHP